eukprot:Sdes_comp15931_c0_seq2m5070
MEISLLGKKKALKAKIPDINSTLTALKLMANNKDSEQPMQTTFELSDHVYANAILDKTDRVCLWLGANVMLEYEVDEAHSLLEKNLQIAQSSSLKLDDDLSFLREQITTMEVNMARVYNWDVKRRRTAKA